VTNTAITQLDLRENELFEDSEQESFLELLKIVRMRMQGKDLSLLDKDKPSFYELPLEILKVILMCMIGAH